MDKVILNPKPGWVIGGEREKQTNSEEKGLFMGEKQRFWGGGTRSFLAPETSKVWARERLFPGGKRNVYRRGYRNHRETKVSKLTFRGRETKVFKPEKMSL